MRTLADNAQRTGDGKSTLLSAQRVEEPQLKNGLQRERGVIGRWGDGGDAGQAVGQHAESRLVTLVWRR